MANLQKLIVWYLEKAEQLDLKATRLTWTDRWCKGWDDIQVTVKSNAGRRFTGRGFARDPNLAFAKASSEALERLACAHAGLSTLGVAVHLTKELARKNAMLELFERQQLGHPSMSLSMTQKQITRSPLVTELVAYAKTLKLELSFTMLANSEFGTVVLCQSNASGCDQIFGLGASPERSEAAEKAAVELARNLAMLFDPHTAPSEFETTRLKLAAHFKTVSEKAALLKDGILANVIFEEVDLESALGTSCILKAERCRFDFNGKDS